MNATHRTQTKSRKERVGFRLAVAVALAKSGMSQRDLAHRLGVADTTLSGWLCGAHPPPKDLAVLIEEALGMRRGELNS
jgi:transcriptional regulator with XRE-family HTH domain